MMKIAIYGAGALGGYFGGRLQQAGHDLHYIARGAHLKALQTSGLNIKSPVGDAALEVHATDNPGSVGVADVVFFLTKLQDTESAALNMLPLIGPNTTVATFQNGIDGAVIIEKVLTGAGLNNTVLAGASYISAEILSPGVVRHNSDFAKLVFGEFDGTRSTRMDSLDEALTSAGIDSEPVENILARLWQKFVFLSAVSGLTALTRLSIGEVLADTETRNLYISALEESAAVGQAECPELSVDIASQQLAFSESLPVRHESLHA